MVLLGVLFHVIGGFSAGSFYAPCKRISKWSWESYWLALGVFAWIIIPFAMAIFLVPEFFDVLTASPSKALRVAFLFGVLWGIGNVTFGLSVRYLGMSLGYSITLGSCAAFGTLIPPIIDGSIVSIVNSASGQITIGCILLCLVGIGICGKAGLVRDQSLSSEDDSGKEFRFGKGTVVALFAGAMSSCMAFAFKAGAPVQEVAVEL